MYLQDCETEGSIKEEELDYQDIKDELVHSGILATVSLVPKVRWSSDSFSFMKFRCNDIIFILLRE